VPEEKPIFRCEMQGSAHSDGRLSKIARSGKKVLLRHGKVLLHGRKVLLRDRKVLLRDRKVLLRDGKVLLRHRIPLRMTKNFSRHRKVLLRHRRLLWRDGKVLARGEKLLAHHEKPLAHDREPFLRCASVMLRNVRSHGHASAQHPPTLRRANPARREDDRVPLPPHQDHRRAVLYLCRSPSACSTTVSMNGT
jgi:hypothetical protein